MNTTSKLGWPHLAPYIERRVRLVPFSLLLLWFLKTRGVIPNSPTAHPTATLRSMFQFQNSQPGLAYVVCKYSTCAFLFTRAAYITTRHFLAGALLWACVQNKHRHSGFLLLHRRYDCVFSEGREMKILTCTTRGCRQCRRR